MAWQVWALDNHQDPATALADGLCPSLLQSSKFPTQTYTSHLMIASTTLTQQSVPILRVANTGSMVPS